MPQPARQSVGEVVSELLNHRYSSGTSAQAAASARKRGRRASEDHARQPQHQPRRVAEEPARLREQDLADELGARPRDPHERAALPRRIAGEVAGQHQRAAPGRGVVRGEGHARDRRARDQPEEPGPGTHDGRRVEADRRPGRARPGTRSRRRAPSSRPAAKSRRGLNGIACMVARSASSAEGDDQHRRRELVAVEQRGVGKGERPEARTRARSRPRPRRRRADHHRQPVEHHHRQRRGQADRPHRREVRPGVDQPAAGTLAAGERIHGGVDGHGEDRHPGGLVGVVVAVAHRDVAGVVDVVVHDDGVLLDDAAHEVEARVLVPAAALEEVGVARPGPSRRARPRDGAAPSASLQARRSRAHLRRRDSAMTMEATPSGRGRPRSVVSRSTLPSGSSSPADDASRTGSTAPRAPRRGSGRPPRTRKPPPSGALPRSRTVTRTPFDSTR